MLIKWEIAVLLQTFENSWVGTISQVSQHFINLPQFSTEEFSDQKKKNRRKKEAPPSHLSLYRATRLGSWFRMQITGKGKPNDFISYLFDHPLWNIPKPLDSFFRDALLPFSLIVGKTYCSNCCFSQSGLLNTRFFGKISSICKSTHLS